MISPGTANTSRPSSSAKSAVISAPLRSRASTTTVAALSPATMRLRAGNRHGAGSTPGGYSDAISPLSADSARELAVRRGIVAVDPAAEDRHRRPAGLERAPVRLGVDASRQAADDDDCRRRRARARAASPPATRRPSRPARRRRRRTSARAAPASEAPRRNRPGGGSWIAARSGGNARSDRGSQRRPAAASSRSRARSSTETRPRASGPCAARTASASSLTASPAPAAAGRRALRRRARARPPRRRARRAIVSATRATRARPRPESGSRCTACVSVASAAFVRVSEPGTARAAHDPLLHSRRGLAGLRRELVRPRPRHGDDEVEAVDQRARELVAERREPLRRAGALDRRVAAPAARAQVHGSDELEARRVHGLALDAGDRDRAVLERLAERLERRARELRQLVEEQHAVVRERRLAGSRAGPAADDRRDGGAVVRRAERRLGHERMAADELPGDGVDARDLERLVGLERREDARAAGGRASSCPSRAARRAAGCGVRRRRSRAPGGHAPDPAPLRGRASAAAGGRSAPRGRPAAGRARRGGTRPRRRGARSGPGRRPASDASGAEAAAQTRRWSPDLRAPSAAARTPPTGRTRPSSASSPTAATPIRPSYGIWPEAARIASAIGRSKPEPSLRSSAGARLTVIRRGRPLELGGRDPRADALLRLLAGAVGQADDRERGHAELEVRLHLHPPRLEPDHGMGDRPRQHPIDASDVRVTCLCRKCADFGAELAAFT